MNVWCACLIGLLLLQFQPNTSSEIIFPYGQSNWAGVKKDLSTKLVT